MHARTPLSGNPLVNQILLKKCAIVFEKTVWCTQVTDFNWFRNKYIYIYIYGETVDFGKSDNMIKISGKVDRSNTHNGFSSNSSFFIRGRTSSNSEGIET